MDKSIGALWLNKDPKEGEIVAYGYITINEVKQEIVVFGNKYRNGNPKLPNLVILPRTRKAE